ncbi:acetolactate synthase small subunit [Clostridia bacterium]|nr:acetolactate synthase small subunit [Clostridia bacterium]GHU73986.1 acetolactate synthase small subunit [Clostridia bacterium]
MQRYVLSIIVDNHAGVLSRVTGLFSRRGYNIESLSVGETENPAVSRITVSVICDAGVIDQIRKQVEKLVDVREIKELSPNASVYRELALIKVAVSSQNRIEVIGIVDIFRAEVVDVAPNSVTIEITGDEGKISAFVTLMEPYGVISIARTGLTGLSRGLS